MGNAVSGSWGKRKQVGMPMAVWCVIAENKGFNICLVNVIFSVLERKQRKRGCQICTLWKDKE